MTWTTSIAYLYWETEAGSRPMLGGSIRHEFLSEATATVKQAWVGESVAVPRRGQKADKGRWESGVGETGSSRRLWLKRAGSWQKAPQRNQLDKGRFKRRLPANKDAEQGPTEESKYS